MRSGVAYIDARELMDRKLTAMEAHRTQTPDLNQWKRARDAMPSVLADEAYLREYPDPSGTLESDLFAALPS